MSYSKQEAKSKSSHSLINAERAFYREENAIWLKFTDDDHAQVQFSNTGTSAC